MVGQDISYEQITFFKKKKKRRQNSNDDSSKTDTDENDNDNDTMEEDTGPVIIAKKSKPELIDEDSIVEVLVV